MNLFLVKVIYTYGPSGPSFDHSLQLVEAEDEADAKEVLAAYMNYNKPKEITFHFNVQPTIKRR